MPSGHTNNFPESGRGLGHVTPTTFGIRSNISPKLLELRTSNLVGGFVLGMPSRRTNNFPESGHGLGHVTPTISGSTVGYPSDSLASCSVWNNLRAWIRAITADFSLYFERSMHHCRLFGKYYCASAVGVVEVCSEPNLRPLYPTTNRSVSTSNGGVLIIVY